MEWLDAMKAERKGHEINRLEERIFTQGCDKAFKDNTFWAADFKRCMAAAADHHNK